MKLSTLAFALLLSPAVSACVDVDELDDPELATDELEVTNAAPTKVHEESVRLEFSTGASPCTGLALSPHWVLTAAHCTDQFTNNSTVNNSIRIYATNKIVESDEAIIIYGSTTQYANASYYRHPNWNGTGQDKNDDIVMIKLYGPGMTDGDTFDPYSARIFWDSREPWKSNYTASRDFYVAGYGSGSPVGSPATCDDPDNIRVKRLGRFRLDPTIPNYSSTYTAKAQTPYGQDICGGDSGAPWLLNRSGYWAFAIHSGDAPTPEVGGQEFGTLIRPKMTWIEQTAAARLPALDCNNYPWNGYTYRQCDE